MKIKSANLTLVIMLSAMIATPSYARGFGGGGFHGGGGGGFRGGGGGGFRGGGGGDRFGGGGGGDRFGGGGGGDRFGGGGSGGGFAGGRFGGSGDHGFGGGGHLPTDGGFGGISGIRNRSPQKINNNDLNHQGANVRNSFNNDTFNKNTNVNQYNVNRYGGGYGYHGYGYGGYHPYAGGWGYPGSWYAPGWSSATAWTMAGLSTLGGFLGMAALAGSNKAASSSNVTYEGDTVYVNGQPSGSQQQYYQQAQALAQNGQTQDQNSSYADASTGGGDQSQQWQPLGVFALAEPGQSQSNMMIQLAINPAGVVRGNYFNQLTNESSEVYGALDKNTQRISWTIGTNPNTVFDAGLGDLTQNDSTVLVHYGPDNTSRMALIRLQQPQGADNSQASLEAGGQ